MHKNSQSRFYGLDNIYFITTKTHNSFPYFKESIFCELLIKELKLCQPLKQFKLYAFCILYDHLHLVVQPGDKFNISQVIQSIKKETSRDINYILNKFEGDIPECRLQGKQYSRRYNKNFITPILSQFFYQFHQKYKNNKPPFPKFQWQKSFYDHVIRNEKDLANHINYTVYNWQKHNLPDNWPYYSLNYDDFIDGFTI